MNLNNQRIKSLLLKELDLEISEEISMRILWSHLYNLGLRSQLIRFMEVPEVRWTGDKILREDEVVMALGATSSDTELKNKNFKILSIEISPLLDDASLNEKGQYKVACIGEYFNESLDKWEGKTLELFSFRLK